MSLSAWTHHSLLKATAPINFAQGRLAKGAVNREARELLRELTRARESYIEQLSDPSNSSEAVTRACNDYLALLLGLIDPPASSLVRGGETPKPVDPAAAAVAAGEGGDRSEAGSRSAGEEGQDTDEEGEGGDAAAAAAGGGGKHKGKKNKKSKEPPMKLFGAVIPGMRGATLYKWMDAISGKEMEFMDAQVELICCLLNLGLWHCLHASVQEAKAVAGDADGALTKQVFNALKSAAAIFSYVDKFELNKVEFREDHDFDERLVESMSIQCLAEAQEVTTTIAMKQERLPKLISGLARDNAELFAQAKQKIEKMPQMLAADLTSYCDFKIKFYEATALCENGADLYSRVEETNECGPAVKCFDEAVRLLFEAASASERYIKEKKRRSNKNFNQTRDNDVTKLDAFRDVAKKTKNLRDKAERERSLIYHDKVPDFLPENLIPAFRAVKLTPYELPILSERWNNAQFDQTLIPLRGEDTATDKASSDSSRVKFGRHFAPARQDDAVCSIQ
eukprot:m.164651 g.164651  ORF g.164651 m.164651 type:complete len:508 (-) comp12452_c0_seq1:146-1669(-)